MTKQETIERFCKLSALVGESQKHRHSHDCFCGDLPFNPFSFSFSEQIISYIERAVEEKMLADERDKELILSIDSPSDYQHY